MSTRNRAIDPFRSGDAIRREILIGGLMKATFGLACRKRRKARISLGISRAEMTRLVTPTHARTSARAHA